MVDISIVIVSWNTQRLLLDCLESIREAPDKASRETIVVDNASSDGTPEAVARAFPEVRLIQTGSNLGFAGANNVGMRTARGRTIMLVNSDVVVLPGAMDALVAFLAATPDAGVVGPRVLNADRTLQISCRNLPSVKRMLCRALALDRMFARWGWFQGEELFHWAHDSERDVEAVSGCFMALRPEAIAEVGLFDEGYFMYAEDIDWCLRFLKRGWRVCFTPTARIVHLGGGSSMSAPARFSVEQERALLRFWKKHHGGPGRSFYATLRLMQMTLRLASRAAVYALRPSRREALRSKIASHWHCLRWLCFSGEAWGAKRDRGTATTTRTTTTKKSGSAAAAATTTMVK
jgi:hypothetical protein